MKTCSAQHHQSSGKCKSIPRDAISHPLGWLERKSDDKECQRGCGKTKTFIHCWCNVAVPQKLKHRVTS